MVAGFIISNHIIIDMLDIDPHIFATLASSCPALQLLDMISLGSLQLVASLPRLNRLTSLSLGSYMGNGSASGHALIEAVCQLTGLRELTLLDRQPEGLLAQLTQLQQLACLKYNGVPGARGTATIDSKVSPYV